MSPGSSVTFDQGEQHYNAKQYAEAADVFRQVTENSPASFQAWRMYGLSLIGTGKVDEGLAACQKAVALQPASPDAHYAVGFALGSAGRFAEAIPELDACLALAPTYHPAKQGLVYALLMEGQRLEDEDPRHAESLLDRAHKIDKANVQVTGSLLKHYYDFNQKGKAVKLLQELDASMRGQSALASIVGKIEADPEYKASLNQIQMAQRTAVAAPAAPPPGASQANQMVPCPNCKQMIMQFAAICPYCQFKLRDFGTFAGRDNEYKLGWQEITFNIICVLYLLMSIWDGIQAIPEPPPLQGVYLVFAIANAGVAIGLFCRQEWIAFVAKIFCVLGVLRNGLFLLAAAGLGHWLLAGICLFNIALDGLMIYLIGFIID